MQHYAIKLAFGENYDAPVEDQLKKGITVLDGGCGMYIYIYMQLLLSTPVILWETITDYKNYEYILIILFSFSGPGTWTLDMAKAYPNSKFHGLDISNSFLNEIKSSNTEFHHHNITSSLPFPENTFGFIHQRLLIMGLRKAEWKIVIDNYLKVLQPGGWLEFTESTPDLLNGGPNLTMLMGFSKCKNLISLYLKKKFYDKTEIKAQSNNSFFLILCYCLKYNSERHCWYERY